MAAPNFIAIMTDQQRMDSLGCYGNVFTKTPHVDRLAAEGARFSAAFTPFPICTPSRATAWTGVMPHTHGIVDCCYNIDNAFDDSDVSTLLFDVLRKAGYDNAYFGKWHLGDGKPASVDHWDAFNSLGGHWIDGKQSLQDGVYKAAVQTERAIILSDDGKHSLFELINDPEEELDLYGAPRQDSQNRYMHFPDQSGIIRDLSLRLRAEARAVSDRFGEALADRVLTQG